MTLKDIRIILDVLGLTICSHSTKLVTFLEFATGVSVHLSCCELILEVPFESVQGIPALS